MVEHRYLRRQSQSALSIAAAGDLRGEQYGNDFAADLLTDFHQFVPELLLFRTAAGVGKDCVTVLPCHW